MHGFPGKVYKDELRILLRKQITSDASQISLFDFLGSSYCGSEAKLHSSISVYCTINYYSGDGAI